MLYYNSTILTLEFIIPFKNLSDPYPYFHDSPISYRRKASTKHLETFVEFLFSKINLIWNSLRVGGAENLTWQVRVRSPCP